MNLQPSNTNNFQGAAAAVVLGLAGKNAKATSVKILGKLPKGVFAAQMLKKENGGERLQRATEQKRFTVEAFRTRITEKLGLGVKIASDKRGTSAGGFVKFIVGSGTGTEILISTLPVERELDGVIYTEYYIWEITVEGSASISPRAGRGRVDLDICVRFVRKEINGY